MWALLSILQGDGDVVPRLTGGTLSLIVNNHGKVEGLECNVMQADLKHQTKNLVNTR